MHQSWLTLVAGGIVFSLASIPASAQSSGPSCKATIEQAGWNNAPTLVAATGAANQPTLEEGRAVQLALTPTPQVQFAPAPDKPGDATTFGGLVQFNVPQKGLYRISAGSAAWVDVVEGGRSVASTSHGHDRECVGVRKMIEFPLEAGQHQLQVAGSPTQNMTVLLTRLP